MAERSKESVKLHGMWASPWVRRVEIALKIKGIPYDYFKEDLKNKSQLLLQYNPVRKLVPVLLHDGKPIAESLIIIEYIDESWKNAPNFLPLDPHERAKIFEKLRDAVKALNDDEEEKIIKEIQESMSKVEANVKEIRSPSNEKIMGVIDILIATISSTVEAVEQAINIKFIDPEKYPQIFSWIKSYDRVQVVEETAPNHENFIEFCQQLRQLCRERAHAVS